MTWYKRSEHPRRGEWAESSKIRREFGSIQASFDLFPTLAGNANKLVVVNVGGSALRAATVAEAGLLDRVTVGAGLGGGGNSGVVHVNLDWSTIDATSAVAETDIFVLHDGTSTKKVTFANVRTALQPPNVTGGIALSGGGDKGSVQINLAFSGLDAQAAMVGGDFLVYYDPADQLHKRISQQNFVAGLNIQPTSEEINIVNAGEGVAGGGSSGDITVSLALNELQTVAAIALTDTLPFTSVADVTANNAANRKIVVSDFLSSLNLRTYTFGDGLTVSDALEVSFDLPSVDAVESIADDDILIILDVSNSNAIRKATKSAIQASFGITIPVNEVSAGNGLEGGGSSGTVTVSLNISGVADIATNIADGDYLAFSNESEDGDPTQKITKAHLRDSFNIPDYVGQNGVSIDEDNIIEVSFSGLGLVSSVAGGDLFPFVNLTEGATTHTKMTFDSLKVALNVPAAPIEFSAGTGIALANNTFSLNLPDLDVEDALVDEDFVVAHRTTPNTPVKITMQNLKGLFPIVGAGTGIVEANNEFSLAFSELPTVNAVVAADSVVVQDGLNSRKIPVDDLATVLKGFV